MARNKVQFQKGLSEAQFDELYGTEERCHAELAWLRWPHGFECPDCGGHGDCVERNGAKRLNGDVQMDDAYLGGARSGNFLGFTLLCSKSRRGDFLLKRKSRRDRTMAKLQEIKAELRRRMGDRARTELCGR
jgi:hypothetical protein